MRKPLEDWVGTSKIVALAFTDVVDSTVLGLRLGEEQWIQLIKKHIMRARVLIARYDCCEIKVIGDSFMVAFRDAVEAFDFALAFKEDTGDKSLKIRIGIHVGRIRVIDNDLYGMMVNYTKRVESAAGLGGIVLSDEAKSQVTFEKASRHSEITFKQLSIPLKGFEQPQTLWLAQNSDERRADLLSGFAGLLAKRLT